MKKIIGNILIYIFLPSIISLILYEYQSINNIFYFICNIIPYLVLIIYFFFKYRDMFIKYIKEFKFRTLFKVFLYLFIGMIFILLSNYIISNYIVGYLPKNELLIRDLITKYPITYFVYVVIIAPICEEITFRLEFKNNIKNKYMYLIVSSSIFSLLHLMSSTTLLELWFFISYFIMGLTFGYIYYKSDNILYNISSHSIYNLICFILICIGI